MNILYLAKSMPNRVYEEIATEFDNAMASERVDIIVTDLTPLDSVFLCKHPNLKIVATLTTGTDHIATAYLEEHGIRLVTLLECPDVRDITSTGEHTFGLILALARNYKGAFDHPTRGRDHWRGHELKGKTLGIIGMGRVGKQVKRFGDAFEMRIKHYDPHFITPGSLTDVLKNSDFVTVHVPLNAETRSMLTLEHFKMMKPSAYFVNTSRGELVQEGTLLQALLDGIIAGAATDFYDNDLLNYSGMHLNLVITPHLGGCTYEGIEKADACIAKRLKEIIHEQTKQKIKGDIGQ